MFQRGGRSYLTKQECIELIERGGYFQMSLQNGTAWRDVTAHEAGGKYSGLVIAATLDNLVKSGLIAYAAHRIATQTAEGYYHNLWRGDIKGRGLIYAAADGNVQLADPHLYDSLNNWPVMLIRKQTQASYVQSFTGKPYYVANSYLSGWYDRNA